MRVFITSFFAHIFLNLYIGVRTWHALPPKKAWRFPVMLLIVAEMVLYGVIYIFRDTLPDYFMYIGSMICLTWLMAVVYFTILLLTFDLLRFINCRRPFYPAWIRRHYTETKHLLLAGSILLVGAVITKGYIRGRSVVINEIEITVKKSNPEYPTLRVAVASDWHIGHIVRKKEVQELVTLINAQKTDIVLLPGDLVDHDLHIATTQQISDDMRQLKAPLGVYAVMGNHEYRGWSEAKIRWIEKCGITLLRDSVVMPGGSFYLIGRDDYFIRKETRKTLTQLMEGVDVSRPVILMEHEPERLALQEAAQNKVDIAFYGHTHRGQVWPHNWLMIFYPHIYGYKRMENTQYIVTSGIGMAGPPLRIGSQSELIIANIRFEDGK